MIQCNPSADRCLELGIIHSAICRRQVKLFWKIFCDQKQFESLLNEHREASLVLLIGLISFSLVLTGVKRG